MTDDAPAERASVSEVCLKGVLKPNDLRILRACVDGAVYRCKAVQTQTLS